MYGALQPQLSLVADWCLHLFENTFRQISHNATEAYYTQDHGNNQAFKGFKRFKVMI